MGSSLNRLPVNAGWNQTRVDANIVPRVTTLGHCGFKLRLTFNVTFFIQVPQLMFE